MHLAMTIALIVVGVLVLIALAGSPRFGEVFYRKMIFGPEKLRPRRRLSTEDPREHVLFPSRNSKMLGAMFYKNPDAKFTVLFSHSNADNIEVWEHYSQHVLAAGASVFAYDYQGFGRSEGKPSLRGIINDGLAAFDYLVEKRGIAPENIIIFGSSLGTGVSTEIARRRKCGGIILHAAFSTLRDLTIELMSWSKWIPSLLMWRPKLDNVAALKGSTVPLLMLHGGWDEMVPEWQPQAVLASSAATDKQLVMLPSSSHMGIYQDAELFRQSMADFLKRRSAQ